MYTSYECSKVRKTGKQKACKQKLDLSQVFRLALILTAVHNKQVLSDVRLSEPITYLSCGGDANTNEKYLQKA